MKEKSFHSNFARATVCINGVPLSMNAEVEVVLKRPAKLDKASEVAWNAMKQGADSVTVELIPASAKAD